MLAQLFKIVLFSACFVFVISAVASKEEALKKLDQLEKTAVQSQKEAQHSQKKINQMDDETAKMLSQYRQTLTKTENLRIYNEQMANYIESQKQEIFEIRRKIEQVKDTGQDIVPLMLRMLGSLEQFIDLDVPFLIKDRKKRVQDLQDILKRSDVSVSEKYRQLIAVFKLELEYGRTLQTYRGIERIDGKELTVDYVRLGRLVFLYISLDGAYISQWDLQTKEWKKLPKSYRKSVRKAVKTAKKQLPPDLIRLPLTI